MCLKAGSRLVYSHWIDNLTLFIHFVQAREIITFMRVKRYHHHYYRSQSILTPAFQSPTHTDTHMTKARFLRSPWGGGRVSWPWSIVENSRNNDHHSRKGEEAIGKRACGQVSCVSWTRRGIAQGLCLLSSLFWFWVLLTHTETPKQAREKVDEAQQFLKVSMWGPGEWKPTVNMCQTWNKEKEIPTE